MPNAALRSLNIVSLLLLVPFFQVCAIGDTDNDNPSSYTADGRPIYTVPLIASEMRVDGVLDEEAWENALVLELNYEVITRDNEPAPVRTDCLLVYSASSVYVAFRCYDPDPSAIRAYLNDRDSSFEDDYVCIKFDTFNDERRSFNFFSNPLGSQTDTTEYQQGGDVGWDVIFNSAGQIYAWGYSVEMAIPFSSLRFQRFREGQLWGLDATRNYPRTRRHYLSLIPRDRNNDCYHCQMVKIRSFEGVNPGRNLEIAPTLTTVRTDKRGEFPTGEFQNVKSEVEAGLTAAWGVTSNLTLGATINPDFSQVEADSLQLDINEPFALFYQERRPFFMEATTLFDLRMDAVHTRTMHDPSLGIKLTGKEGAHTIGAFVVRDEVTNLIFPGSRGSATTSLDIKSTASIFRYARDFSNRCTLGVVGTDREGDDYFNRVIGFDGNFRFTDRDRLQVQIIGSSTSYPETVSEDFDQPFGVFGGSAFNVYYTHNSRNFDYFALYREVGRDFRADLGFMPRGDYRSIQAGTNYTWIADPGVLWYSEMVLAGYYEQLTDHDGQLIYRDGSVAFEYKGPLQSRSTLSYHRIQEAYNDAQFDQNQFSLYYGMQPTGGIQFWTNVNLGERVDYANARLGERVQINPGALYKIGRHFRINLNHIFERLSVDGARLYTANTSDVRIVYQFDRRTFLRAILQYIDYRRNADLYTFEIDPVYRRLSSQLLFSYKINPRTVLFLGYTDNHFGSHEFGLTQANRTFFVKLGYAWVL